MVTPRGILVFVGYVDLYSLMCRGIRLSKVLSPLEKNPLCSFWECNPGLIPKLNEYKIVHFLIYDLKYNSLVQPRFDCCIGVWGKSSKLQRPQNRAARILMSALRSLSCPLSYNSGKILEPQHSQFMV